MNVSKTQEECLYLIGYDTYYKGKKANDVIDCLRDVKGLHCFTKPYPVTELTIGWTRNIVCVKTGKFLYHEGYQYAHNLALSAAIDKAIEICEKEGGKV